MSQEQVQEYLGRADDYARRASNVLNWETRTGHAEMMVVAQIAGVLANLADYWLKRAIDERPR